MDYCAIIDKSASDALAYKRFHIQMAQNCESERKKMSKRLYRKEKLRAMK